MGTIVYSSLIDYLLAKGPKSSEELIKGAVEEFGFVAENIGMKIRLQLKYHAHRFKLSPEGKYTLLKKDEWSKKHLLEMWSKAPEQYFKDRPACKKLKEALESIV